MEEGPAKNPDDLVRLAQAKAERVGGLYPQDIVIAADTGVFRDGRAFGKPKDLGEAREILQALSDGWHSVFTGLVVRRNAQEHVALEETRVHFRPLALEEINWYLAEEQVLDKAGAYAIQGKAAIFVDRIEGDFFNIMGLPLSTLARLLGKVGWRPWGG